MTSEERLHARLRKIEALLAGATTPGERLAAESALARIKARLAEAGRTAPAIELQFSIADPWSRQLFLALARRYGLTPYRYLRQRRTTVMLQAPESFWRDVLWPELSGLRGEESIAAPCRREGIAQSLYYSWSKEFLEAGKKTPGRGRGRRGHGR